MSAQRFRLAVVYITLRRTTTAEFEAFLSLVYPTELGVLPNPDENGWRNILSFASTCGSTALITTALAGLDAYLQPIEKVLLGDKLGIPALTKQGVREVCIRTAPPTFNEGRELGLENVVSVAILRGKTQCYRLNRASALTEALLQETLASGTPTWLRLLHARSYHRMRTGRLGVLVVR
ncbi:hypothetical protein FIBSPDRAFT_1036161 [Athelia psychrophila]|uniref:Uncharacterized protein n=1 Tax=Athelia psychrophila TaxID=1759441 RepID=A0A166WD44_9AGAM|nr:hypothetical protein FIBSPDRAFT_1036161 [Fibularhizoctonia sp. CBS 109695]